MYTEKWHADAVSLPGKINYKKCQIKFLLANHPTNYASLHALFKLCVISSQWRRVYEFMKLFEFLNNT